MDCTWKEGRKEGAESLTAFAIKGELSRDESAPAINLTLLRFGPPVSEK
jgi:hypothetical protein